MAIEELKTEYNKLNIYQKRGVIRGITAYLFLIPGFILSKYHPTFAILIGLGIGTIIISFNDYFIKGKKLDNKTEES